jgi:hypothetical protein
MEFNSRLATFLMLPNFYLSADEIIIFYGLFYVAAAV